MKPRNAQDKGSNSDTRSMKPAKRKNDILKFEAGKFCLDVAKLVFAGVILGGIMAQDVDYLILYTIGLLVTIVLVIYGFLLIAYSKDS